MPDFAECIISFLTTSVTFHDAEPNFHFSITIYAFLIALFLQLPVGKTLQYLIFYARGSIEYCVKFVRHVFVVLSMHSLIIFQSNFTVSSFMSICVFTIAKLIKDKCLKIAIPTLRTHLSCLESAKYKLSAQTVWL